MKVRELLEKVKGADPEREVVVRRADKDGYFCDHDFSLNELYPGELCITVLEPIDTYQADSLQKGPDEWTETKK